MSAHDPSRAASDPSPAAASGAPQRPALVWDAATYRQLARAADGDLAAARQLAREAGERERARGAHPTTSPFVVWALLADLSPDVLPGPKTSAGARARRDAMAPLPDAELADARPDAQARREKRARLALAAVAAWGAHVGAWPAASAADRAGASTGTSTGAPAGASTGAPPVSGVEVTAATVGVATLDDPESALARHVAGRVPKGNAAWNAYLVSLAHEIALDPTPQRVARLTGPLDHVRDRARFAEGEFADEFQDAIVAAYDAAADSWSDEADVPERQAAVAARREGLERAVLAGRVARGWGLIEKAPLVGDDADRRVHAAFAPGLALWVAVLQAIVAGEVELEGAGWRRTLWALQVAFALGGEGPDVLVSADALVRRAADAAGLAGRVRGAEEVSGGA